MNARKFLNVRVSLTVTALALGGAMVFSAMTTSCAGGGGSGGSTGNGGSSGNGGSAGGSTGGSACDTVPADTIGFCQGSAKGLMTGAGWVALGSLDTLTDPTCGTDKTAITKAAACTSATTWNDPGKLCMTGSIPALPGTPVQTDYDNNWGVQIGLNATEPNTQFDASAYTGVTFNISGAPLTGNRAMIHRAGDSDSTTYCATFQSGNKVALTAFNTKCWDGSGVSLASADLSKIDKMGIQVSSTSAAITVANLCLTSIVFAK